MKSLKINILQDYSKYREKKKPQPRTSKSATGNCATFLAHVHVGVHAISEFSCGYGEVGVKENTVSK